MSQSSKNNGLPDDYDFEGECHRCRAPVTKSVTHIKTWLGYKTLTTYHCEMCELDVVVKG